MGKNEIGLGFVGIREQSLNTVQEIRFNISFNRSAHLGKYHLIYRWLCPLATFVIFLTIGLATPSVNPGGFSD